MGVLSEFLEAIMGQFDTESSRRSSRDLLIAFDFVFHKEVLKHRVVMQPLRLRWNISESTVKQAVASEGKRARRDIPGWRREFERRESNLSRWPELAAGVTFEEMAARQINAWSQAYRDGTDPALVPRKPPRTGR